MSVKGFPALMLSPDAKPDIPTIPTIRSWLLVVVTETVELAPEEVETAETADPKFGSKGEAVFAPLTEKTMTFNPSLFPGALSVMTSLDNVPEEIAYQHSISPPLAEVTLPLGIHVRPLVSEMP
jgi:hypothetical protein